MVADGDYYERMILYISPACLEAMAVEDCDPAECFRLAQQSFQYVYRDEAGSRVRQLFQSLHQTIVRGGYGASLLTQAQFTELLVEVNRLCRDGHGVGAAGGDSKVVSLLQYLNLHLSEPLSIDDLSARFYISKYHMMRRFRQETGYSITATCRRSACCWPSLCSPCRAMHRWFRPSRNTVRRSSVSPSPPAAPRSTPTCACTAPRASPP